MRTILFLVLNGLMLGDGLAALLAALILWKHRGRSHTFRSLAYLFASVAAFLPMLFAAVAYLPRPRPDGFRFWMIAALAVLGIGVWRAALDVILLAKSKRDD